MLPAEAGLDARAIDFAKGCYPGQEPIARQHYRGRVNRSLRVLALDGTELPEYDAELTLGGKSVGRVTSAARDGDSVVALAYVRVEVPPDATPRPRGPRGEPARLDLPAPVAQGIERCPAEAEAASSNLAGRTTRKPRGCGAFVVLPAGNRSGGLRSRPPDGRLVESQRHDRDAASSASKSTSEFVSFATHRADGVVDSFGGQPPRELGRGQRAGSAGTRGAAAQRRPLGEGQASASWLRLFCSSAQARDPNRASTPRHTIYHVRRSGPFRGARTPRRSIAFLPKVNHPARRRPRSARPARARRARAPCQGRA